MYIYIYMYRYIILTRISINRHIELHFFTLGANRGIGLAAVKTLAKTEQWNIIMACRSIGIYLYKQYDIFMHM
jgi:hypothetical protein